jgi:hypothetical protein
MCLLDISLNKRTLSYHEDAVMAEVNGDLYSTLDPAMFKLSTLSTCTMLFMQSTIT